MHYNNVEVRYFSCLSDRALILCLEARGSAMLNSISSLGETRPEQECSVIPIFRNFRPTSRGTPKISEWNSGKCQSNPKFPESLVEWKAPKNFGTKTKKLVPPPDIQGNIKEAKSLPTNLAYTGSECWLAYYRSQRVCCQEKEMRQGGKREQTVTSRQCHSGILCCKVQRKLKVNLCRSSYECECNLRFTLQVIFENSLKLDEHLGKYHLLYSIKLFRSRVIGLNTSRGRIFPS